MSGRISRIDSTPATSIEIERVPAQVRKRNDRERFLVRGFQHDRWRNAGVERLAPASRAHAPAVARPQSGKLRVGNGRDEIVAACALEIEKLARHPRADDMNADVFGGGIAASVAIETGPR
jgi:hypothetical protein